MSTCTCDEKLCPGCSIKLKADLECIAGLGLWQGTPLTEQLDVTITKQNVTPKDPLQRGGTGGDEQPILFDESSSDAATELRQVMRRVRHAMTTEYPHLNSVTSDPTDVSKWILLVPGLFVDHPEAVSMCNSIRLAVHSAVHAIDDPPQRMFLGPCPDCGTPVFIALDVTEEGINPERCPDRTVRCTCGKVLHAPTLRQSLVERVKERVATAKESIRLVNDLSGPETPKVTASDVSRWRKTGLLPTQGKDESGAWLYRVGDVTQIALDNLQNL